MVKTIFIITGFRQNKDNVQFKWMRPYFSSKNFRVKVFAPSWNHNVMSDYVNEFVIFYESNKSDFNYVLGFSFGGMIAFISASILKPDGVFLCSLSPYFKEDLKTLEKSHKQMIGLKRINDFSNHSAGELTEKLCNIPVSIFYGEKEADKYPRLRNRCILTHKALPNSILIAVKDVPHRISHPEYVKAIKSQFK